MPGVGTTGYPTWRERRATHRALRRDSSEAVGDGDTDGLWDGAVGPDDDSEVYVAGPVSAPQQWDHPTVGSGGGGGTAAVSQGATAATSMDVEVDVLEGSGVRGCVEVEVDGVIGRTAEAFSRDPSWGERFIFRTTPGSEVRFRCLEGTAVVGGARLPLRSLPEGPQDEEWLPILHNGVEVGRLLARVQREQGRVEIPRSRPAAPATITSGGTRPTPAPAPGEVWLVVRVIGAQGLPAAAGGPVFAQLAAGGRSEHTVAKAPDGSGGLLLESEVALPVDPAGEVELALRTFDGEIGACMVPAAELLGAADNGQELEVEVGGPPGGVTGLVVVAARYGGPADARQDATTGPRVRRVLGARGLPSVALPSPATGYLPVASSMVPPGDSATGWRLHRSSCGRVIVEPPASMLPPSLQALQHSPAALLGDYPPPALAPPWPPAASAPFSLYGPPAYWGTGGYAPPPAASLALAPGPYWSAPYWPPAAPLPPQWSVPPPSAAHWGRPQTAWA